MMVAVLPAVTPVASPLCVTVAPVEALQVTLEVMFCVLPSAYVPVAVNCCVPLGATAAVAGVTAMDFSGLVTVRTVELIIDPEFNEMVVVPPDIAVARPEVFMVATEVFEDCQFPEPERVLVVPSLKVTVTVNCWVAPNPMVGLAGVILIDSRAGPPDGELPPPQPGSTAKPPTRSAKSNLLIATPRGLAAPRN